MSNKLANSKNSAGKQLERARRQTILARLLDGNKKNMSFEQMAAKMREDHWVAQRWPSYSASTAHADFNEIMGLVRSDVGQLAMPYFVRQVDLIDENIAMLKEFAGDEELDWKLRIDASNSMRGWNDQSLKIFGNYAPKEMHIQKLEAKFDLNDYNELKEQFSKQLDDVIDGDIEEDNNDIDEVNEEDK